MAREALSWHDINLANLSDPVRAKYDAAVTAKQEFEAAVINSARERGILPKGKTFIFSHKPGRVGYAEVAERNSGAVSF